MRTNGKGAWEGQNGLKRDASVGTVLSNASLLGGINRAMPMPDFNPAD